MRFDPIQALKDERETALRIWEKYYHLVAEGGHLNSVRDSFEREIRALDWAITELERMGRRELHD